MQYQQLKRKEFLRNREQMGTRCKEQSYAGRKRKLRATAAVVLFSFLAAFPLHWAYGVLGRFLPIGWLVPVNESVWEHLKLAFYPLSVLILLPFTKWQKCRRFSVRVLYAAMASLLSLLVILFGHYGLYIGWEVNGPVVSVISDIGLLLLGNAVGVFYGFYRMNTKTDGCCGSLRLLLSGVFLVGMVILFAWWTVCPPDIEVFRSV